MKDETENTEEQAKEITQEEIEIDFSQPVAVTVYHTPKRRHSQIFTGPKAKEEAIEAASVQAIEHGRKCAAFGPGFYVVKEPPSSLQAPDMKLDFMGGD